MKKFKLDKNQVIKIPSGDGSGDLSFWREVLLLCSDRKAAHKDFIILVDEDMKDQVEASINQTLTDGYERLRSEVVTVMRQRHGSRHRSGWGGWSRMMPKWYDVLRTLGNELCRGVASEIVWLPHWVTDKRLAGKQEGVYLIVGDASKEVIHVGGRVKTVIIDSEKSTPQHGKGSVIKMLGGRVRWNAWMAERDNQGFITFLGETDDEAVALLYKEFPSCREIQRELVKRSQDFHISDDLKPKVTWNRIGQIKNAELRRTLMTVGIVKDYPEPEAVDDEGELFSLDQFTKVLKLTCPSTGRIYHLGVPANLVTPREARRWTLNLPEGAEILSET